MKRFNEILAFTLILGLFAAQLLLAQNPFSQITDQETNIKGLVAMVTRVVSGLIGLVVIVRMVMIIAGSQQGEDKLNKAAGMFVLLCICALAFFVAPKMFGGK